MQENPSRVSRCAKGMSSCVAATKVCKTGGFEKSVEQSMVTVLGRAASWPRLGVLTVVLSLSVCLKVR